MISTSPPFRVALPLLLFSLPFSTFAHPGKAGNSGTRNCTPARHMPQPPETCRSPASRSEEHTSELRSLRHLVCRLPRRSALFPYTTLFRSLIREKLEIAERETVHQHAICHNRQKRAGLLPARRVPKEFVEIGRQHV